MASRSPGGIVVLDDDGDEPPPAPEHESPADHPAPPAPSGPRALGKDPASLRAENQRLLEQFIDFCAQHTKEHPEVMPFLAGRHQKTSPKFLASVEFHNVMSRCLARVQAKRSKVYVYINELCTVFKAHSQKKQQQQQLASAPDAASPSQPPGPQAEAPKARGSKRHIRYLEKLLQVHAKEIRRLQEKELDLEEMESEDSAYMQESRLKRHMMRIFKRLCELKDCNSLTGRVIEQRIPYRGTRYPEVNRRIERLVNQSEAFPDYSDILKVVQKASIRHNLALPKCQMERMAADAFREVGNRLQERRQMDLVYNFGCHLTDQYQPSADPALTDSELAQRLRRNRQVAVQHLDQVVAHYAQQQQEEEWRRKRDSAQAGSSSSSATTTSHQEREPASLKALPSAAASREDSKEAEEEEEDDDDTEEESSSSSSEFDMEVELEEEGPVPDEDPPAPEAEADQRMDLGVPDLVLYSSAEDELDEEQEEEQVAGAKEALRDVEQPRCLPPHRSPASQLLVLEIEEAVPLEPGETPPPSPSPSPPCRTGGEQGALPAAQKREPLAKCSRALHNGGSCQAGQVNGQPSSKKVRREQELLSSSSCIEVPSSGSSEEDGASLLCTTTPWSPAPLADSTCADSPGLGLVTSSQGSPPPLSHVYKTSVATQYDPEEIIVLSDSD